MEGTEVTEGTEEKVPARALRTPPPLRPRLFSFAACEMAGSLNPLPPQRLYVMVS